MLQAVVRNFLALREARIGVRGFTILKGASSGGKSSFLKALILAMTNRIKPAQVRFGGGGMEIKIRFEGKGSTLAVRRAVRGSTTMELGDVTYSTLGRSVPQEVVEFCGLGVLDVGGEKVMLNYFPQFQKPLLLGYSQKRIADILSASRALEDYVACKKQLDVRREQLNGSQRSLSGLVEAATVECGDIDRRCGVLSPYSAALGGLLAEYDSVEVLCGGYDRLSGLVGRAALYSSYVGELDALGTSYLSYMRIGGKASTCDKVITLLPLKGIFSAYIEITDELGNLYALYDDTCSKGLKVRTTLNYMNEGVVLDKALGVYDALGLVYDGVLATAEIMASVEASLDRCGRLDGCILERAALERQMALDKELMAEGVCPLCGGGIKNCNDMLNLDEVKKRREEIVQRHAKAESRKAMLDEQIEALCSELGVEADVEALKAKRAELRERLQSLNDSIEASVAKAEALEKQLEKTNGGGVAQ